MKIKELMERIGTTETGKSVAVLRYCEGIFKSILSCFINLSISGNIFV